MLRRNPFKKDKKLSAVYRGRIAPFARKRTFFKVLVPGDRAVSIPNQDFYMIPIPIQENEP
jgi:hypothetical protein